MSDITSTTYCLIFSVATTFAIAALAHFQLRYPHCTPSIEKVARYGLPMLTAGVCTFLPGAICEHFPVASQYADHVGYLLGFIGFGATFLVQPHRMLFSDWNSPALGLALAYYQNHLRRVAVNLASDYKLERNTPGEGDGRRLRYHSGVKFVVVIALPSRVSSASMSTIGQLKHAGRLHEYGLSGNDGDGTRPDALYSTTPLPESLSAGEVTLVSIPTIASVIHDFVLFQLSNEGNDATSDSVTFIRLEERQKRLFRDHTRRLLAKHTNPSVVFSFRAFETVGIS